VSKEFALPRPPNTEILKKKGNIFLQTPSFYQHDVCDDGVAGQRRPSGLENQ